MTAKVVVVIGTFKGLGGCNCFLVRIHCPGISFSIYIFIYVCINIYV